MTERRRDERFHRALKFQVTSGERGGIEAESVNISSRGLYCVVDHFIPPFSKLNVALDLPLADDQTGLLECEGVVVRVEPETEQPGKADYRLAIYFLNLGKDMADLVESYLENEHA